jgi:hypothetical protein
VKTCDIIAPRIDDLFLWVTTLELVAKDKSMDILGEYFLGAMEMFQSDVPDAP